MTKVRRSPLAFIVVLLLLALPLCTIAGDAPARDDAQVVVEDHQLVLQELTPNGEVEGIQVVDWLALDGDGTITVERPVGLSEPPKIQGMRGFKTPKVENDQMVWKDLKVDGHQMYVTNNKLSADSIEPALENFPLETEWRYWLDGEEVEDVNDIAGKDGHFKMSLTMTNTSQKKTEVTYTDSITGEEKVEEVETYMPLVIQPTDWYFDNTVFSNLKADETGLIFYQPTVYQVGWSIPLFPPASEESHTIWVEADVKNLTLEPLSLAIAFVFPETNQTDPIPQFHDALTQLYGGVQQLGAGLSEAVLGIGGTGMSDTLLYGISQVYGGLGQLAGPEGLPQAGAALSNQLIPGTDQIVAGIGSPEAPDTLMFGTNAVISGLQQLEAAIGTAETPETLLYGSNAVTEGLQELNAAIGNATTDGTLLFGVEGMAQGLEALKAGIGSAEEPDTLINAAAQIRRGLTNPSGVPLPGVLEALQQISGAMPDLLAATQPGGTIYDNLQNIRDWATDIISNHPTIFYPANPTGEMEPAYIDGTADALQVNISSTDPGDESIYYNALVLDGTVTTLIGAVNALVDGVDGLIAGLQALKAGIGTVPEKGTLMYAAGALQAGLMQLSAGIGDVATPETLLYGANAVTGGLTEVLSGIGSPTTPDTLLYGSSAVFSGLSLLKGNVSTGSMANPGLKEGLMKLNSGVNDAVAGLGSPGTPDTLLYGASRIEGGLGELKAGLEMAVSQGTEVMQEALAEGIQELDLTEGELAAITERGENFDSFLGRVENPDSESDVRFLVQTRPVEPPPTAKGWIIALILSVVGLMAIVFFGIFAFRPV